MVDVDPETLAAEAAAVDVLELPAAEPAPGEPAAAGEGAELTLDQAEALAASYEAAAFVLFDQAASIAAPNWNVTREEKRQLAHSTAVALAHWFPNQQLPPKYAALLTLAGTAYGIAEARRDPDTGRIRPLRAPRQASAPLAASPSPGGTGATFTTGG